MKRRDSCHVHSADASFVLFLIELATDVDVFVQHVLRQEESKEALKSAPVVTDIAGGAARAKASTLRVYATRLTQFLHHIAEPLLARWCDEAEAEDDLTSACVAHAYRALLWSGADEAALKPRAAVARLLGSAAFVRNWHGFGIY